MQGQSSRAKRSPTCKSLPSHTHSAKIRDKDVGNVTGIQMRKFGDLDSGLNDIPMSVPTGEVDLSPDEGTTSWLNYTLDDFFHHDYNSEFFHEPIGDTVNETPPSVNHYLRDKKTNCNREFRDCHNNPCSATQHSHSREITEIPSISGGFSGLKMHKNDPITPSTSSTSTIINFPHFARPASSVNANLQSMSRMSGLSLARSESMLHMNKGAATTSGNPPESAFIIPKSEHPGESNMHCQQALGSFKYDLETLELKSLEQKGVTSEQLNHTRKEDTFKDDQTSDQVLAESGTKGHTTHEKSIEQAVASSSVCSGNGAEMFSTNSNQNLKQSRDTEGSEGHSEDVEEESAFARKAGPARGGTGSNRSRAAEVHNLFERRRRDRINEKMRALQELIPNCNKVDKASMLDEAIEYLKTLQLQVQIMSMGTGLYVPPMMLPHGMQHMHSHMSPFPPMGGCMPLGLGMGYAMRMANMSSGCSRFPMIQVPQMQGTHISVPSMFGATALHGMERSNPQMFGLCGQGFHLSGAPLMNPSTLGLNGSRTAGITNDMDSASASGLKGPIQGTGGSNPTRDISTQVMNDARH
ncbi:hypothetical protein QN277_021777 [Acacia crassicarpa]|uniref:BHLH domain-containing protein n=1 Tax=Acacia crassicarpa TaxID=499986 RepID=A0AAE1JSB8_9FABA|nr:hypothetical protein QN277_021777 [Acacia crassicarpa]